MILTSAEVDPQVARWDKTCDVITDDAAQTIASWWQSPGVNAITRFSHGMPVDHEALRLEVVAEIEALPAYDPNLPELCALLAWAER